MRYQIKTNGIELIFDDWDETCRIAEMFISQGYTVQVCGVIEDE